MKFQATRDELSRAIGIVQKAVPSKASLPILYSIMIDATGGNIRLTGTDLSLGITTDAIGFIEEQGQICIDARMFAEIIRKLPNDDVWIESGADDVLTIKCGKSKFKIAGKDADSFQYIEASDGDKNITISQGQLKRIIQQTIFSISPNDANQMMTGEYLQVRNNTLRIVALDGHRIAIRQVPINAPDSNFEAIVPGKTLNELSRILIDDPNRDVQISFSANHVVFTFDGTTVVSSLIQGSYFKVDQMLTDNFTSHIKANKGHLASAVDRATLFAHEGEKRPVVMTISDDTLNVQISSAMGSMSDDMPVELDGEGMRIGVNPRFLLDVLKSIDADEVDLYMVTQKSPVFIQDSDKSYVYMVLPVNF